MKKARILFVLCLVAALTIGMAVTVSAEETKYIDSIWVELPTVYAGDPIPEGALEGATVVCKLPQDGEILEYTDAVSVAWSWSASGTFEAGKTYYPALTFTLKEGYAFKGAESVIVMFSGDSDIHEPSHNGSSVTATAEVTAVEKGPTMIDYIHITGVDLPYVGDSVDVEVGEFTATPYGDKVALPEEAITMKLAYPYTGGTFSNSEHLLSCTINVSDGYQLADRVAVQINDNDYPSYIVPAEGGMYYYGRDITFYPLIPQDAMVRIPSLPDAVAGEAIEGYSYTPADGSYTVTGTWLLYDYATGTTSAATGNFVSGKLYMLEMSAVAAKGYSFGDRNLFVEDEGNWYGYAAGSTSRKTIYNFPTPCGEMNEIWDIQISGLPTGITAGQSAGAVELTTEQDVNLSAKWVDADGYAVTGTFEDGKVYYLSITVTPKEGSYLGSYVWVYNDADTCIGGGSTNGHSFTTDIRYSLVPVVTQVDITGVVGAVIGQAPTTEGIKAPEGANYTITDTYWSWATWVEGEELTVFEDKNKYVLYIHVHPADGYEFSEDTVLTVNGKEVRASDINPVSLYVGLEYSFLTQIEKVDITVPIPQIGQTASLEGIVLPDGLVLDTDRAYWYENVTVVTDQGNYEETKIVEDAFLKGHKYYLHLNFDLEKGYEFADEVEFYFNGVLVDGYDETYVHWWETWGYLETAVSFRDVISKVEITGVTDAVVGQTATTEGIKITGVGEYEVYWSDADSDEPFTGVFETGKAYYLNIGFDSAEGTEFADDLVVTVNGVEPEDDYYNSSEGGNVYLRYSFKTVIDKVEFIGLPQFTVGGTASMAGLKAPDGANYTVAGQWGDISGDDGDSFTGTFQADGIYMLVIYAEPKDGYEFSEDLQILVDGKAPATREVNSSDFEAYAFYYYAPAYKEVGKLELTVKDPVIGETFKSGEIETAKDATYSLYAEWYISADGENWKRVSKGTFEEGKYYAMRLYVNTRDVDETVYWFGNQAQVSVNGVDVVWDNDENYAGPMYAQITQKFGKLCAHTYGAWTSVDSKTHSQTCSKCGNVATAEHTWTDDKDDKCDTCGYDRSDNPPTGDAVIPAALLALCSVTALVVLKKRED